MAAAARIVEAVEAFAGRPVGMRGAVGQVGIVLRTGVLVGEDDGERRSGRVPPVNARYKLRRVGFAARRGSGRTGTPAGQIDGEILLRKRHAGGHAVEHQTDLRPVRLAPQGNAEMLSEAVHRQIC